MSEQHSIVIGKLFPHVRYLNTNWELIQATEVCYSVSKTPVFVGDWGLRWGELVFCRWPAHIEPMMDPTFEWDTLNEEVCDERHKMGGKRLIEQDKLFWGRVELLEAYFRVLPSVGHELIEASKAVGYDSDIHGRKYMAWLMHKMGEVLKEYRKNQADKTKDTIENTDIL